MPRVHLFEVAEQEWCPHVVRDALTDYLTFMIERGQPYAPAIPILAAALNRAMRRGRQDETIGAADELTAERTPDTIDVVDLAAGAGGPWRSLVSALTLAGTPVRVRLTDRHPNMAAYARLALETNGRATGDPRPVSADAVPANLTGFRTMFSAFHHFAPADARRVLANAAAQRTSIAVFEATRRDLRAVLLMCLTPLFVVVATPFIRPFRWTRLLLTYVVPVIPLAVLFDGVVSCLRTYTPAELRVLARESAPDGYTWEAGEIGNGPLPVTYLLLEPKPQELE
jgi:hypothetical protein